MKQHINNCLYSLYSFIKIQLKIVFTFKKKIFILSQPQHSNLGDQAQLYCTLLWLKKNYPKYTVIELGYFMPTLNLPPYRKLPFRLIKTFITLLTLKLFVRDKDLFIGHSGYFFVDHHNGWTMFLAILRFFKKNKMIIFPQTINFYTPEIKRIVSEGFNSHSNELLLMCRDEISYENAQKLFPNIKLLLFPDIVTSLIGTKSFLQKREGILFCIRHDVEAYYSTLDINNLMNKFFNIKCDKTDTTINISSYKMERNRKKLIESMIEKMATFQVVITDRYHGTIFSAIASTPVIVISSADHKLSSGVKWFPESYFKGYIYYAESLNEAYRIAKYILKRSDYTYKSPSYFKDYYYDKLYNIIANQ